MPSYFGILKSKVIGLHVDKLKILPKDLKKLCDAVDKEVLKRSKHNTDMQDLDENVGDVENKILDISGLFTNTAFNTNT